MQAVVDTLAEIFELHTGIQGERGQDNSFCVRPLNDAGFVVEIVWEYDEFTVYANNWHGHFCDAEDAVSMFLDLLGNGSRIEEVFRATTLSSARIQLERDGTWRDGPSMGFIFLPFWKEKHVVYSQNTILSKAKAQHILKDVMAGLDEP